MPNNLAANPISIDTVMAAAANPGQPMYVKMVYWFNPTTIAHAFNIHDSSSGANVLLEGRAEVANQSQVFRFDPPQLWRNFQVSVIGSGILYIYF